MKAVILAGGLGTRISEETNTKPKPMVSIGGKPLIWHILKIYSYHGINEFVICCGYKGYVIKEYFSNYFLHSSDVTFHMDEDCRMEIHSRKFEPWKVTLVDTGDLTNTGGRLKNVKSYLNEDNFCFTYGDGVANINIKKLVDNHIKSNKMVTLSAVQPAGRFGALKIDGNLVEHFQEKPDGDNAWINGGFFVVNKKAISKIKSDETSWEVDVLPKIAALNELNAFKHFGFWQPMDTLRDKNKLEQLAQKGNPPWLQFDNAN